MTQFGVSNCVAWSPDEQQIASGGYRGAEVWNAGSGKVVFTHRQQPNYLLAAQWSPDGTRIATACGDGDNKGVHTVQVWDAKTASILYTYEGHSASVGTLDWSPDGERIASGSYDHTVHIWQ